MFKQTSGYMSATMKDQRALVFCIKMPLADVISPCFALYVSKKRTG